MNRYFQEVNSWTESEIIERAEFLFDKYAAKIWPYPNVDFSIFEDDKDFYNLDDEFETVKKNLIKVEIETTPIRPKNWIDGLLEVTAYLHENCKTGFRELILDSDNFSSGKRNLISVDESTMYSPKQVPGTDFYIESSLGSNRIISLIKLMAESLGLEGEDIRFFIR